MCGGWQRQYKEFQVLIERLHRPQIRYQATAMAPCPISYSSNWLIWAIVLIWSSLFQVILLECLPKESSIPGDIFSHFNTAYTYAKEGNYDILPLSQNAGMKKLWFCNGILIYTPGHTVSNLGYTIFGQPFLGSMDNAGFLYIKPTFQVRILSIVAEPLSVPYASWPQSMWYKEMHSIQYWKSYRKKLCRFGQGKIIY